MDVQGVMYMGIYDSQVATSLDSPQPSRWWLGRSAILLLSGGLKASHMGASLPDINIHLRLLGKMSLWMLPWERNLGFSCPDMMWFRYFLSLLSLSQEAKRREAEKEE